MSKDLIATVSREVVCNEETIDGKIYLVCRDKDGKEVSRVPLVTIGGEEAD